MSWGEYCQSGFLVEDFLEPALAEFLDERLDFVGGGRRSGCPECGCWGYPPIVESAESHYGAAVADVEIIECADCSTGRFGF